MAKRESSTRKLYVMTGLPDEDEVEKTMYELVDGGDAVMQTQLKDLHPFTSEFEAAHAQIRRQYGKTVDAFVQMYVAAPGQPFAQAWTEPAKCTLVAASMGPVSPLKLGLMHMGVEIRNAKVVDPCPGMEKYGNSKELAELMICSYYSFSNNVGIIYGGYHTNQTFERQKAELFAPLVDLKAVVGDGELKSQAMLKKAGIPKELLACPALLERVRKMNEIRHYK